MAVGDSAATLAKKPARAPGPRRCRLSIGSNEVSSLDAWLGVGLQGLLGLLGLHLPVGNRHREDSQPGPRVPSGLRQTLGLRASYLSDVSDMVWVGAPPILVFFFVGVGMFAGSAGF